MASHDTNSLLISSSEFSYYDSFVDENLSMSPDGPLSHSISGSSSSYSSPLGSEVGSPETESEDEATLAELTRRMAEFAFEDDEDSYIDGQSLKTANNISVFQQIPEAGGLYASGYNSPSSAYNKNHGLLNASKQLAAVLPQNLNSDNFLQMCQMRNQQSQVRNQELERGGRRGKNATERKHQHNNTNDNSNNNNNVVQNRKTWKSSGHGKRGGISSTVPLNGGGSGIRAVFLGGSNTNRSSKGTGVFLPSANYGAKADPKKKPTAGCSTVLIPARVLQTLQQHFNNVGAKSQSQNTDVLARINGLLSQEKEQAVFKIQPPVLAPLPAPVTEQEELRLPQEWTY